MKRFALLSMLFLPLATMAQKQYFLPTASSSDDEKDKPMIEVYLPQQPNGCAVVLCPGGAMRWLSWENADEWHISKDKIGFLGFSAGGGVAIAATMSADNVERPDFLCTNFGPSLMPVTVPQDAPPLLILTRADHPNVAAGLAADGRDHHRDLEQPDDSLAEG